MRPYLLLLVPYLLGALVVLWLLRGRHLAFAVSSGLLWGLALHVFLGTLALLLAVAGGWRPLYPVPWLAGLTLLLAGGAACAVLRDARSRGESLARIGGALAVGAGALALAVAAALHWNYSAFAVDSFAYLERGLGMARIADRAYGGVGFLQARGLFGAMLHAPTDLAGVEYLYFVIPVLGLAGFATLATAIVEALRRLGRSRRVAGLAAALSLGCLGSSYFVAYQGVLLHVNWLVSSYLLLFFFCAWMALELREDRWLALSAVALFAFVLLRVEAALFAAAFVAFLAVEPREEARRPRWPVLALVLPALLWCGVSAVLLGDEPGRISDRPRLLLMGGALAIAGLLGCWACTPAARRWLPRLAGIGLAGLAIGLLVLFGLAPQRMLERSGTLLDNALLRGSWSSAWALVGALALAGRWLAPVPHQGFVRCGLLAYGLLLLGLSYVAPWRPGWFDSGNRMLGHVLPSLAWLLAVRAGAIVPAGRGAVAQAAGGRAARQPTSSWARSSRASSR